MFTFSLDSPSLANRFRMIDLRMIDLDFVNAIYTMLKKKKKKKKKNNGIAAGWE
jgi:hypothetical protein